MKKTILFSLFLFTIFAFAPTDFTWAQQNTTTGLAQLSGCSGPDCTACNVVDMANGIIKWLIGILFVVFALLMAVAGVRLVISGGNSHALDEAKSSLMSAVIGFIIILSAWLIVDTIMRALVGTAGHEGQLVSGGSASGYLFWSQVQCQVVKEPKFDKDNIAILEFESQIKSFWPGDPSSAFSGSQVLSVNSCAATPAGNVNCTAMEKACRDAGNSPVVDKINPVDYKVTCINVQKGSPSVSGSGSTGCSGGSCVSLTIPCSNSKSCSIAPDMVTRLASMHSRAGVSGARVTEAMPPSRVHKSACHQNGTCIDYSKAGGMSASEVIRVINSAQSSGLRPVYEVQTQSQKNSLVAAGASASNIIVLGNWISAPHFSIYGN